MTRRLVASEILRPGGRIGTVKRWGRPLWLAAFYHDDGAMLFASFLTRQGATRFRETILDRVFFGERA